MLPYLNPIITEMWLGPCYRCFWFFSEIKRNSVQLVFQHKIRYMHISWLLLLNFACHKFLLNNIQREKYPNRFYIFLPTFSSTLPYLHSLHRCVILSFIPSLLLCFEPSTKMKSWKSSLHCFSITVIPHLKDFSISSSGWPFVKEVFGCKHDFPACCVILNLFVEFLASSSTNHTTLAGWTEHWLSNPSSLYYFVASRLSNDETLPNNSESTAHHEFPHQSVCEHKALETAG